MMLNFSNEQTVSLEDELNLINSYIVLEQLRLINSFEWKVLIGKNIKPENIGIPPMIIQPFVENAIIHGLLSLKNRKGVLDLNFAIEGDLLQVKITDNGIGRQLVSDTVTSHKPSGILISRKRLELINKLPSNDNSYLVTDLKDKFGNAMGTEVVLKIKIEVLDN
jgi:LytS/YehU family sensor histidine kinase